jgi:hypothetical protein
MLPPTRNVQGDVRRPYADERHPRGRRARATFEEGTERRVERAILN